ncbi:hypothetical protein HNQ91_002103 [Filimonas zeae]|uniref:Outer membrane protein beta-barrel domain-containing protein n=1 Tax=Filimonas zeae TaxID=1737353 RepID=A0A917IVW4_9BACT|nr:hypothetical protein [Filimonas zeae]MDR6339052.1 hypothetical protein [Filimonas zeae]GGH65330.1 hypothetical protein GCM10011379_18350 [Filimonas zeae]
MPELQQLENQGWEQMVQMLNQHLPQEAPPSAPVRPVRILFMLVAAACLGILFCMPVLLTDSHRTVLPELSYADGPATAHPLPNPAYAGTGTSPFMPVMASGNKPGAHLNRHSATMATALIPAYGKLIPETAGTDSSFVNTLLALTDIKPMPVNTALPSEAGTLPVSAERIPERLPLLFFPEAAPATAAEAALKNKQPLLSLVVQLNHNLTSQYYNTGNMMYNLPAYPSVTASVHVSKNISFTTGFSVLSSGSLNGQIKSEAITPVTNSNGDAASAIARVDQDVVKQAFYMQVPVTMDVAVRRNLAVSSGAGFAFLQKTLVQREARTTDANNNQLVPATTAPGVTSTLLSKEEVAATAAGRMYNIRSSERRFLLNVQYQLKKFNIGLQYSRALSPSVEFYGHPERNIRNQTLTLSVGMPLFQR